MLVLCKFHVIEGQKVHDQILNNRWLNLHDQMMFYTTVCISFVLASWKFQTNVGYKWPCNLLHKNNLEIRTVDSSDLVTHNYTDIVTVMIDLLLY